MVRSKVKRDRASENERYIIRVFDQRKHDKPADLRYATFKLDDGVSFVHIVSVESTNGANPLGELAAFNEFTSTIRERCEELPVFDDLQEVGSYRVFES